MGWPMLVLAAACAARTDTTTVALEREARLELILERALAASPELGAARARARAAAAGAEAAGRLPDLELMYRQRGVPLDRPYALDDAESLMFGLVQRFPAPGERGLRSRAAGEDAAAAAEVERARALDLRAAVLHAYAEYYRVEQDDLIHREHVAVARQIVELARANHRAGRGSQEDVLRTIVELSRSHLDAVEIDRERTTARARLNTLMARAPDAPLGPPAGPAPVPARAPAAPALEQAALERRPELAVAERAVSREDANLAAAERAAVWPSVLVGADYAYMPQHDRHAYELTLGFSLPWINPVYGDEVRRAEAALGAERRALEAARLQARFEVHDASARFDAARDTFAIIDGEVLPQAEQSFEAARAAFAAGGAQALGVLDALRVLQEVRLEHERARAVLVTTYADLLRAAGAEGELEEQR